MSQKKLRADAPAFVFRTNAKAFVPKSTSSPTSPALQPQNASQNPKSPSLRAAAVSFQPRGPFQQPPVYNPEAFPPGPHGPYPPHFQPQFMPQMPPIGMPPPHMQHHPHQHQQHRNQYGPHRVYNAPPNHHMPMRPNNIPSVPSIRRDTHTSPKPAQSHPHHVKSDPVSSDKPKATRQQPRMRQAVAGTADILAMEKEMAALSAAVSVPAVAAAESSDEDETGVELSEQQVEASVTEEKTLEETIPEKVVTKEPAQETVEVAEEVVEEVKESVQEETEEVAEEEETAVEESITIEEPVVPEVVEEQEVEIVEAEKASESEGKQEKQRRLSEYEAEEALGNTVQNYSYNRDFLLSFQQKCTEKPSNLKLDLNALVESGKNSNKGNDRVPRGKNNAGRWRDSRGNVTGGGNALGPQTQRGRFGPGGAGGGNDRYNNRNERNGRGGRNGSQGRDRYDRRGDKRGRKGGRDGYHGKHQQPMNIEIIPLSKSETRYVVQRDIEAEEKLKRTFNSILNKLTPEKFNVLVDKVLELDISNADMLRQIVLCVFEKAIAEPTFSPTYAGFCETLSKKMPTFGEDESGKSLTFKRLILNQCQNEFEKSKQSELTATDEGEQRTAKKRMLGTIRFIGELFVRKMLSANIMQSCLTILFGDRDNPIEENMEALCKLLFTIGKQMDVPKNRPFLNQCFQQLAVLSVNKDLLSSRIRFKIKDTIDLRRNRWVPRAGAKQETAKKISDIHKDNAKEKQIKAKESERRDRGRRDDRGRHHSQNNSSGGHSGQHSIGGFSRGRQDRYAMKPQPALKKKTSGNWEEKDEWSTVKKGGNKWQSQDIRGKSNSRFANRGEKQSKNFTPPAETRDSRIKKKAAAGPKKRKKSGNKSGGFANAFSMLGGSDDEEEDEEEEEEEDEEEVEEEETAELEEDEARGKTKALLNEFLTCEDKAEAKLCIEELHSPSHLFTIVSEGLNLAVDMKDRERVLLSALFSFLITEKMLSSDDFTRGFDEHLEFAEDIMIDIPRLPEHVGVILAQVVIDGGLGLDYLSKAVSFFNGVNPSRFAAHVLKAVADKQDDDALVALYTDSKVDFKSFMPDGKKTSEDTKTFLTDRKVPALVDLV